MMQEIVPGIFMITEQVKSIAKRPEKVNIFIIPGEDGLIYEAGYGMNRCVNYVVKRYNELKKQFEKAGKVFNVRRILISHTHPDHFAGLYKLKKKLGLKIILTERMAHNIKSYNNYNVNYTHNSKVKFKKVANRMTIWFILKILSFARVFLFGLTFIKKPDIIISENDIISINNETWSIMHSPGHSEDHISLYNENSGVLFSGDNVLSRTTTWLGPPRSDLLAYTNTVKQISELKNLKVILGSHDRIVADPQRRLEVILKWRNMRINDVYKIISEQKGGIAVSQVVESLYPGVGFYNTFIVFGWIELTLEYLMKIKKINMVIRNGESYFCKVTE